MKKALASYSSLSGYAQAQSATHSRSYNALPDNEQLCMKVVGRMLAKQHMIFSDTKAVPNIRRATERAIDATREAFGHRESYCKATRSTGLRAGS
ncbi:hypothetical protein [uncultured Photobacterium sp.]|uniref:hypothetical protein n=1 Tax=uncultured Photobacterium sp. TaxID=173973 RepID=UPI00260E734E|nr:hypothetical protein [uncultured Photobacterium sp.]